MHHKLDEPSNYSAMTQRLNFLSRGLLIAPKLVRALSRPAAVMGDGRTGCFNGTGPVAMFTGTETMIAWIVDVDAWDKATGVTHPVDPKRGTGHQ
ncbi:hypothetical protein [Streptomyces sp. NPDC126522]|uniref:hypothetical protein n=1 Tax=Streptomyces sp. NPDC126522 TaxID=3155211 RepID=UPI00331DB7C4